MGSKRRLVRTALGAYDQRCRATFDGTAFKSTWVSDDLNRRARSSDGTRGYLRYSVEVVRGMVLAGRPSRRWPDAHPPEFPTALHPRGLRTAG